MAYIRSTSRAALAVGILTLSLASTASGESFRTVMQGLAIEMNRVQSALFVEDFATIVDAADAIVDHPRPSPDERRRILAAVEPHIDEFRSLDQQVHEAAENLADAASDRDLEMTIRYHGRLVAACIACHSAFREDVVGTLSSEDVPDR
nr:cytochrome c [Thioalkalivibrio nitratireducens]